MRSDELNEFGWTKEQEVAIDGAIAKLRCAGVPADRALMANAIYNLKQPQVDSGKAGE